MHQNLYPFYKKLIKKIERIHDIIYKAYCITIFDLNEQQNYPLSFQLALYPLQHTVTLSTRCPATAATHSFVSSSFDPVPY